MFSFDNRRQDGEVTRYLRRLSDLTSPNLPPLQGERRSVDRQNRVFPVALIPWRDDRPVMAETVTGLVKNLSAVGLAVVMREQVPPGQVLVGFLLPNRHTADGPPEPSTALGRVIDQRTIGGGFHHIGIRLDQIIHPTDSRLQQVFPWIERLLPTDPPTNENAPV